MIAKEKTLEDLRHELEKVNQEIKLLEAKGENLGAEMKVAYREQMVGIHDQRMRLNEILTQVQEGGEGLIERLTDEYEKTRATLESSISELQEKYEDK